MVPLRNGISLIAHNIQRSLVAHATTAVVNDSTVLQGVAGAERLWLDVGQTLIRDATFGNECHPSVRSLTKTLPSQ